MNEFELLTEYYGSYDEESRLASKHGQVEFLTTMNYINKYLKKGDIIIEIGAGTGRYSHTLARMGYDVTAVELIEHNLDILRSNTLPGENITAAQGNAVDLSAFSDETFDITLLLGPMYHLFTVEDQLKALSEAFRVTKTGGIVYAAYCNNDATVVQFLFERNMIKERRYKELVDSVTFKCASTPEELFVLYRKEDIDALMRNFPYKRLHYIGTDMAANFMRDVVDAMDEETFSAFMRYHFFICERPDMTGATHHILDITRKQAKNDYTACSPVI